MILHFNTPDHAITLTTDMGNEWNRSKAFEACLNEPARSAHGPQNIPALELLNRG